MARRPPIAKRALLPDEPYPLRNPGAASVATPARGAKLWVPSADATLKIIHDLAKTTDAAIEVVDDLMRKQGLNIAKAQAKDVTKDAPKDPPRTPPRKSARHGKSWAVNHKRAVSPPFGMWRGSRSPIFF